MLDVDDTLYLERDYVRSGFMAVGGYLAERGVEDFGRTAWSLFEKGSRRTTFDETLAALGCPRDPALIGSLIDVYRAHRPAISLCADAAAFLETAVQDRPVALITDGPVSSQGAKIAALGIEPRCGAIVMTDEWGVDYRKPHHRAFAHIESLWPAVDPARIVYVADNPLKDFLAPKARGWRTARIIREGGEHGHLPMAGAHAADETITSFDLLDLG